MLEGVQRRVDGFHDCLPRFAVFDEVVDVVFDEDFFERRIVPTVSQFVEQNLEFLGQKRNSTIHRMFEDFGGAEEVRLVVHNDARICRERNFAVGECVERVDCYVGRHVGIEGNFDAYRSRRLVVDVLDFYLALFARTFYGFRKALSSSAVWKFGDGEHTLIYLFDFCADTQFAAPRAVLIFGNVDAAASQEVGVQHKFLAPQVRNRGVHQFVEIVW